ncbi:DUF3221 domain-containing protein [Bacillus fonticola]|uniref:DUF3221 domain-containing protein n=1 Tax=Bacillus fonticola TaxID=2728853 RepID=UPI001474624A|nr:hypothetical protein [Bacillus fonticola]
MILDPFDKVRGVPVPVTLTGICGKDGSEMRAWVMVLVGVLAIVLLSACGSAQNRNEEPTESVDGLTRTGGEQSEKTEPVSQDSYQSVGIVLAIDNEAKRVLLKDESGSGAIWLTIDTYERFNEIQRGDKLGYNVGFVAESYPAQGGTEEVDILEKQSFDIVSKEKSLFTNEHLKILGLETTNDGTNTFQIIYQVSDELRDYLKFNEFYNFVLTIQNKNEQLVGKSHWFFSSSQPITPETEPKTYSANVFFEQTTSPKLTNGSPSVVPSYTVYVENTTGEKIFDAGNVMLQAN